MARALVTGRRDKRADMRSHPDSTPVDKLKSFFLEIAGWLIPLAVSAPSLFIWAGLMTMPLIVYLVIMLLSLFEPSIKYHGQEPSVPYFLSAIDVMLFGGTYLPDKVLSILGLFIMVYSAVYLNAKRKKGLVTSGPYRLIRNPQYLGAVLFVISMTSRSYREVLGDVGWLGPAGTLLLWFGTLIAYVVLALVEEAHLSGVFGEEYAAYRSKTALLIPFAVTRRRSLDIILTIVAPIALLWGVVWLNRVLYP